MKTLIDYFNEISKPKGIIMKPKHIMAEQLDGEEVLFNTSNDRWSRNAKHHLSLSKSEISKINWNKGDIAIYEGNEVEIIIPSGPNATVGILYEGKTKMVLDKKLSINEGVIGGIKSIDSINRIMQLAGLNSESIITEPASKIEEVEIIENTITSKDMFNKLLELNLSGKYKNNIEAAKLATVGQFISAIEIQLSESSELFLSDKLAKINEAVKLGKSLIDTANFIIDSNKSI